MTDKTNDELREAIREAAEETEDRLQLVQELLPIYEGRDDRYREDTCNDDGNEDHYDSYDEDVETSGQDFGEEIVRLEEYIDLASKQLNELKSMANNKSIDEDDIYEKISEIDDLYPDDAVYEDLLPDDE
ncbi:hypothetical protein J7560_06735 [Wohlfahrtiimonas chitiniclastica]|uniref:hypothetical protein n=1 Tax=Wohlfahrtiimonas chitiniclastica TaxID=400946 RepID=UPI001BD0EF19|nr:hypothetical protein [Wohlfahrtiimonas chitiniclastica]MBS7815109.1 hypothetical protein [Wohlfahrtiimonas chitiniclastica]